MAANKFATMLHRNTNKITLVLIYALLEWILIVFLLLNALFSYLIIKFSDYFGLKRPCLWCSRLDHIFEPAKFHNSYGSLVCEAHALEISKLGYCSNHRKLAEALDMCEDCSSSSENELSKKFAFFPWMKQLGVFQENGVDNLSQNDELVLKCSCCDINLDSKFQFHDHQPIDPSWGDLDNTQKGVFNLEFKVDENDHIDRSQSGLMEVTFGSNQGIDENCKVHVREREEKTLEASLFLVSDFVCDQSVADESKRSDTTMGNLQEPVIKEEVNVLMSDPSCHQTVMVSGGCREVISCEIEPKHLEFYIDQDDCHLIPVELMGSSTNQKQNERSGDKRAEESYGNEDFVLEFDKHVGTQYELVVEDNSCFEENLPLLSCHDGEDEPKVELFESREVSQDGISSQMLVDFDEEVGFTCDNHVFQENSYLEDDIKEPANSQVSEESFQVQGDEIEADVSIGTEIPDRELIDDFQAQDLSRPYVCSEETPSISNADCDVQVEFSHVNKALSYGDDGFQENSDRKEEKIEWGNSEVTEEALQMEANKTEADASIGPEIPDKKPVSDAQAQEVPPYLSTEENPEATSAHFHRHNSHESKQAEEDEVESRTLSAEISVSVINNHFALCSEGDETEEDRIPNTPTTIDGLHHSYRKFLSIERRESVTEDSLDGSVMSDIEAADGVPTIEKLKSALRNERKALNALYVELEEERSASAVATSHTMAMINRLQEEKAAVQMEALQYQRMMEEQAAYDQEALQLLNELMVKREKEKAEIEKELEVYRRRVENYEAKERMMLKKRIDGSPRNGTSSSSVSCSNAEESDGLSVDLNHEAHEEDRFSNHQESGKQNTPPDAVLYLEESLANFEDERMSILEELKALEEKLITLSDEEEQRFEDIKPIEHLYNGNGYHEDSCYSSEANGFANGHYKEMNGKHKERKMGGAKAKRLLPLFDATTDAHIEDEMLIGHAGVDSVVKFDMDSKKVSIEEDVDHVYERLQALEADREFLKHCITSLKKGDKGIELLQEILHHLRDLRSVELRVRNMGDGVL
ncbi:hypothetical protein K2173_010130 [Erythroxylum novogranatense]|uniref:GTD-binding domain-containing protein n=1 Tax=Erythroxylum novogranatense TaxID=1862640 RepID=A0AAV8TW29_9ROSI|nr:hypothetical protein K2173_010130 [Erythroxylum novogranatense]